ncbi:MAG: hypothetical protein HN719_10040 [Alphaproteobacteria bacterium]|nr:hypothetical protein [Alphaproteobacteria bacterium]MBT7943682.1 hypothetical protein [Alphaproteobacteria bacterium]
MNTPHPTPRVVASIAVAFFCLASTFFGGPAAAQEANLLGTFGDWEAYKESDGGKPVCYMGTQPKKSRGKYKTRGEIYMLITHRPAENSFGVVSVRAGYAFKKDSEATVTIGKNTFGLFTDIGHAFAKDNKTDAALVKAMIRGAGMVIKGISSRGTKTTDTYSLKGFTAAWKSINAACKAK